MAKTQLAQFCLSLRNHVECSSELSQSVLQIWSVYPQMQVHVTLRMLKSLALLSCPLPRLSKLPRCQKNTSVKLENTEKVKGKYLLSSLPQEIYYPDFTVNQSKYFPSK